MPTNTVRPESGCSGSLATPFWSNFIFWVGIQARFSELVGQVPSSFGRWGRTISGIFISTASGKKEGEGHVWVKRAFVRSLFKFANQPRK